jgi:hypothetical protein
MPTTTVPATGAGGANATAPSSRSTSEHSHVSSACRISSDRCRASCASSAVTCGRLDWMLLIVLFTWSCTMMRTISSVPTTSVMLSIMTSMLTASSSPLSPVPFLMVP